MAMIDRVFSLLGFLGVVVSLPLQSNVRARTLEQRRGQEAKVTKVDVGIYIDGPYYSRRGPYGSLYDPYGYSYPYYNSVPYSYPYYNRYYYYPYGPRYNNYYHRWNRW